MRTDICEVDDFIASGAVDFGKIDEHGTCTLSVEGGAVHALGIDVGYLAGIAAGSRCGGIEAEHEVAHLGAVEFAQLVESAVA